MVVLEEETDGVCDGKVREAGPSVVGGGVGVEEEILVCEERGRAGRLPEAMKGCLS